MLDDLKVIHHRDKEDALGIAERQSGQLKHRYDRQDLTGDYKNVVFAGMGGSALPALLVKSWPGINLPFEVVREYNIPKYVGGQTLFIACSYSGNTEETLNALTQAEAVGAKIVILTGGGQLQQIAELKNYPIWVVPKAEQPRYAVFYMVKAILTILESTGLSGNHDDELERVAHFVDQAIAGWLPTVPQKDNPAKKLAFELAGKSIAVYAGPLLAPVAYKWKISFQENAKNVAWWNELPEFDHNEMMGWTSHPVDKPYGIIELRSKLEHPRIMKRFEVAERLLSGRRPAPFVVDVPGGTLAEQIFWAVAYGDFVSLYLALLNNQDPAPVALVEKFKKALDE